MCSLTLIDYDKDLVGLFSLGYSLQHHSILYIVHCTINSVQNMILTSAYFAICKTTTKLMSELCIIHLCKVCMYKKITLFHVFFCLHVCMPACLPSCLSAVSTCQPACLPVYQLFLPVSLPSCLSAVSTCQPAFPFSACRILCYLRF